MAKGGKKLCKYCKSEIPWEAKICPNCRKKQGGIIKWIIIGVVVIAIIGSAAGGKDKPNETANTNNVSNVQNAQNNSQGSKREEPTTAKQPEKDKYSVGDTWENKTLKVIYTDSYEFTDYGQFNAPADGNKIICLEFEFENIGKSDATVMYTDFHGYADGYEVEQSYAPDGTGLDFTIKMSAGRKGTGKVAFEVPNDAKEIEIEFSPNFFSSEKVIFIY